jgi:DNA-binding CsgD family transcriptional regulator
MTAIATISPLSARETTVLRFIAWGYTNKEIARHLTISVKTVEAHKANGMRKLQVTGRAALVRRAVEWGWLQPENDVVKRHDGAAQGTLGKVASGEQQITNRMA